MDRICRRIRKEIYIRIRAEPKQGSFFILYFRKEINI